MADLGPGRPDKERQITTDDFPRIKMAYNPNHPANVLSADKIKIEFEDNALPAQEHHSHHIPEYYHEAFKEDKKCLTIIHQLPSYDETIANPDVHNQQDNNIPFTIKQEPDDVSDPLTESDTMCEPNNHSDAAYHHRDFTMNKTETDDQNLMPYNYLSITMQPPINDRLSAPENVTVQSPSTKHSISNHKSAVCHICQKHFARNWTLKIHMRRHTGEKPYTCTICSRNFTDKSHLVSHMNIHTGKRSFECEICHADYTRKENLAIHMRMHTGDKPIQCHQCKKSFARKRNLDDHMLIHTGARPFKCPICIRKFSRKFTLKIHMRQHMQQTNEKPAADPPQKALPEQQQQQIKSEH